MPSGRTKEEVGVREIYQAFRTVGGFNRKLWNDFCTEIKMLIQFSRSAVWAASDSTLTGDGKQGPYHYGPSGGAKRKRTKRRKKRRKRKTRKRRKRKTRKRKTRKKKKRIRR